MKLLYLRELCYAYFNYSEYYVRLSFFLVIVLITNSIQCVKRDLCRKCSWHPDRWLEGDHLRVRSDTSHATNGNNIVRFVCSNYQIENNSQVTFVVVFATCYTKIHHCTMGLTWILNKTLGHLKRYYRIE